MRLAETLRTTCPFQATMRPGRQTNAFSFLRALNPQTPCITQDAAEPARTRKRTIGSVT